VRSGKTDNKAIDKHAELLLWITIIIAITLATYVSLATSHPIFSSYEFETTGIIIIYIGIVIRFIAIKQLGRFFTVDVTIRENHQLMQRGFYSVLRYPSYSGALLSFLGFGFSLNNWLGLPIAFIPVLFMFIHRINTEENVLTEQFGEQYTTYINKTKRIILFVY
jgi:protein-S-isoprenylcysteine O-methyltransferase Ste14